LEVTANVVPSSPILVTLMMEALSSSKTSVLTRATWHNILEDGILHSLSHENLKSYTENEIKSIIHSLKAKNSADYDGITSKTLKACASLISHPLILSVFPNCLKISVVRQLHKKGDKASHVKLQTKFTINYFL
jgi:hypothetical protein